ncbi:MAG TPA: hypothetical protein VLL52_11225, partial [Anaerolineae bacterium]|nr:hypothetical protein [Anaerolineae bacterium]
MDNYTTPSAPSNNDIRQESCRTAALILIGCLGAFGLMFCCAAVMLISFFVVYPESNTIFDLTPDVSTRVVELAPTRTLAPTILPSLTPSPPPTDAPTNTPTPLPTSVHQLTAPDGINQQPISPAMHQSLTDLIMANYP